MKSKSPDATHWLRSSHACAVAWRWLWASKICKPDDGIILARPVAHEDDHIYADQFMDLYGGDYGPSIRKASGLAQVACP